MKKIFILILFFIFSLNNFNIAYSISPDVFIQSTVNRASKVLSEDIPKNKKMDKLKIIAKETVDIRGIGFYSLGSARKGLNESQKKHDCLWPILLLNPHCLNKMNEVQPKLLHHNYLETMMK